MGFQSGKHTGSDPETEDGRVGVEGEEIAGTEVLLDVGVDFVVLDVWDGQGRTNISVVSGRAQPKGSVSSRK